MLNTMIFPRLIVFYLNSILLLQNKGNITNDINENNGKEWYTYECNTELSISNLLSRETY